MARTAKKWATPRRRMLALAAGCLLAFHSAPAWSMTLREAADLAVKTYPDVRAAEEFGKALDQKVQQAFAGYLPKMDFTAGYGPENADNTTTRLVNKSAGRNKHDLTMNRGEAGVVVKQNLFDGFDVRSRVSQAKAQLQAAQARLELTADTVALLAIQAYVELVMKHIQLELIKDNVLLHQRILSKVQKKFEGGAGPEADVHQAKSRTLLASANHASNQAALENAQAKFSELIGLPALTEMEMLRPRAPEKLLPRSVEEVLQEALHGNPELVAARWSVAAAEAGVEGAKAALWPKLDVELTASNTANVAGTEGHAQSTAAMLRMNYNAFDGGADVSRIQEQRNLLEQARQNLDKTRRSVEENTRETWHKLVMSQNRIRLMKQHYAVSRQVTASYHDQFKMGKRTLLDVLNSENELFSAKNGLLFEELTYVKSAYELFARMGTLRDALNEEPPASADQKIHIERDVVDPESNQPVSAPDVGEPLPLKPLPSAASKGGEQESSPKPAKGSVDKGKDQPPPEQPKPHASAEVPMGAAEPAAEPVVAKPDSQPVVESPAVAAEPPQRAVSNPEADSQATDTPAAAVAPAAQSPAISPDGSAFQQPGSPELNKPEETPSIPSPQAALEGESGTEAMPLTRSERLSPLHVVHSHDLPDPVLMEALLDTSPGQKEGVLADKDGLPVTGIR
ncbi:MAG: TolC family outer membrane protein [Magnetococcus sp. MYC-9]